MGKMPIRKEFFGKLSTGEHVFLYTLTNRNNMAVKVTNYGAAITAILIPVEKGKFRDVALGFENAESYEKSRLYLGATVGRYAGQIKDSAFRLKEKKYVLYCNDHGNCMHGGKKGFDKKLFSTVIDSEKNKVIFHYVSKDGEEGFPGTLDFSSSYQLTDENRIVISYKGICDQDTVLNITNHTYFNLDGHNSGSVEKHRLKIYSDEFLELGEDCCPDGKIRSVCGTSMDFREWTLVGENIDSEYDQLLVSEGYDHNWNISGNGEHRTMAELESSGRDLKMVVSSDLPGLQVYTGNYLNGSEIGKEGCGYRKRGGMCLEAQFYPAAPNFRAFPSAELKENEEYSHTISYQFFW